MRTRLFRVPAPSCWGALLLASVCFAAADSPGTNCSQNPYSRVETGTDGATRIYIDLQNAPNNLEPCAEPRRIQVDDRAKVQLVVRGLSPFDLCSLSSRTPTPTPETNVAESIVGTIAKLGAFGISGSTQTASQKLLDLSTVPVPIPAGCDAAKDPEYQKLKSISDKFFEAAKQLATQVTSLDGECEVKWKDQIGPPLKFIPITDQAQFACQIDQATRQLTNYAGGDFRGEKYGTFKLDSPEMQLVRHWYWTPPPSIAETGELQAMLDEMTTWAGDLHKKYDYPTPAAGGSADASAGFPPVVGTPVVVTSPTALSFTYPPAKTPPDPQIVHVWGGGAVIGLNVTTSAAWLRVNSPCMTMGGCRTLTTGTLDFEVRVDPASLNKDKDTAWITFADNAAGARSSAIVGVSVKPSSLPDDCAFEALNDVDQRLDRAKAIVSLLGDYNKALETAQGALKTNYMAVVKVWDDYQRRGPNDQKIVLEQDRMLVQSISLGTDRKGTVTGVLSCVSDLDGKTPTTSNINYSILYQDVPRWTASAGLLASFQQKRTYGTVNLTQTGGAMSSPMVEVTDKARAQAIPMAFVNWRFMPYHFNYRKEEPWYGKYGKNGEDKLVWTSHLSAGFGINPNNAANQPEFFTGLAVGLNRFMVQTGVHWGRRQFIGGGYFLNGPAPSSGSVPIGWAYRPAFSIGFSVRVAPY